MAAGSIVIDLLLKSGSFETDTKRAEKRLNEMRKEAEAVGKVIGVAFVAAAAGLVYMVKSAIDSADAMGKASQAAGIAVDQFSALAYAAKLSGVESEGLSTALNILNKKIASSDQLFSDLGINVRKASGEFKNGDEVLGELADRFAALPIGSLKSQIALDLLGKSGAKLVPLLNLGSSGIKQLKEEAASLGIVISSETARAAEEFNDNITRLKESSSALGLAIAQKVLPVLNDLLQKTLDNARAFGTLRGAFVTFYEATLGGTGQIDVLREKSAEAKKEIVDLREQIKRIGDNKSLFSNKDNYQQRLLPGLEKELAEREKQAEQIQRSIARITAETEASSKSGEQAKQQLAANIEANRYLSTLKQQSDALVKMTAVERVLKDIQEGKLKNIAPAMREAILNEAKLIDARTKVAKAPTSEAERYLESLVKQEEATLNLTSLEKALNDIQKGRLEGLTPALKKQILAQAELNDVNKAAYESRTSQIEVETRIAKANLDSVDSIVKSNAALREEINLMGLDQVAVLSLEKARTSSLRAMKEEQRVRLELSGIAETQLQVLDAEIAALREREELLGKKIDKTFAIQSAEAAKKTGESMRDTLGDSIEQGILDGFRHGGSLAEIFLRELKAQFARTILRPLIQPAVNAGNSGINDVFSSLASLFKYGGSSNNPSAGNYQNQFDLGFGLATGTNYVPSDNFPALLHKGEAVVPAKYNPANGGAQVTVHNYASAEVQTKQNDDGTLEIIIQKAAKLAHSMVAADHRSGTGPSSAALKSRGLSMDIGLARRA